jgi:hypothetical protein
MLARVLKTNPVTLSHSWLVGETPTDPTGTTTYTIVDANGDAVTAGNATLVAGEGRTTAVLAGQAVLKHLTVTWAATVDGTARSEVDYVEVVGGFYFTTAEGRASDASLADPVKYPPDDIEAARLEVEVECEEICERAFVPRYRRLILDGTGTSDLVLQDAEVRSIRRVAVAPTMSGTFTDLTAGELAALAARADRTLRRTDGNVWTEGFRNVVVEYEYGLDRPPVDLVKAAKTRLRTRLNINKSSVPDRAMSFTVADGGTYRLSLPGPFTTGIPEVDAAYARYSLREGAGAPNQGAAGGVGGRSAPASRTLTYQPQRSSLFHR